MKKKIIIFIIILIIFFILVYLYSKYIGTKGLIVKEYKITNSNVPTNFHGLKLIHLSDIHYNRIIKEKELKKIVKKINIIKPDIVVLTGDLLDRDHDYSGNIKNQLIKNLKDINVSIKKYAIRGNHDFHHFEWEEIIKESGFVNLDDDYDLIYKDETEPIFISGVSSNLHGNKTMRDKLEKTTDFLNEISLPNKDLIINYKILIMHEPDFIKEIDSNKFNLILAGHSHDGQIRIPFIGAIILPPGAKKYYKEYYKLNSTDLFISSGLGTSNLDVRLFNKPSFNFYRITNN